MIDTRPPPTTSRSSSAALRLCCPVKINRTGTPLTNMSATPLLKYYYYYYYHYTLAQYLSTFWRGGGERSPLGSDNLHYFSSLATRVKRHYDPRPCQTDRHQHQVTLGMLANHISGKAEKKNRLPPSVEPLQNVA